jgi:hypothetical protein
MTVPAPSLAPLCDLWQSDGLVDGSTSFDTNDTNYRVPFVKIRAIRDGSSGSDVVAANKTTTDADGNGFDSPEGEANPFPSESVVVSAGMATPSPVDPS